MWKSEKTVQSRSTVSTIARLLGLVGPLWPVMVGAVVLGVAGHVCATSITVMAGLGAVRAFDVGLEWPALIGAMAAAAVMRGALRYGEQASNHFIAFKLLALIRDRIFGALRRLAPAKLEGRDKGDLIALITQDVELLEVFFAHTISPVLIAAVFGAGCVAVIAAQHAVLAFVAGVSYVLVGVVLPVVTGHMVRTPAASLRGKAGKLSTSVLDTLRGMDELCQYDAVRERLAHIDAIDREMGAAERLVKRMGGVAGGLTGAAIVACDAAMLAASTVLLAKGLVTAEGALVSQLILMGSFGPFVSLANLGTGLSATLAAGSRVLDLLDEEPRVGELEQGAAPACREVDAKGVSFSYGEGRVLSDVDLSVRRGEMLGIQGKSGCGKSTLLRLLMRFWDVDEGSVAYDGCDVRHVQTAALRRGVSFVEQQTTLFHDSICNNVTLAKPDATDEEVELACRRASVHEFIMGLPQGYDTPVGELGETLSGGERQRLGLARAFLHDANVLLLDEPTSNLDSLNEGAVLKAIDSVRSERAVVLVSHRASALRRTDSVLQMDNGRIS